MGHRSDASAVGIIAPFRTFKRAEELGTKLGRAVAAGLAGLEVQKTRLGIEHTTARLPLKAYPPVPDMADARESAFRELGREPDSIAARQKYLFARIEEYYASVSQGLPELPVEITAVRIGDVGMVSIPGEAFHDVGAEIRAQSPFPLTLFLGLANDYIGYIPTDNANASLGYEVVASRVDRGAAAAFTEAAVTALNVLHRQV